MYEGDVPDQVLLAMGFRREDFPDETIEVLPDNWQPFLVFDGMSTQWRTGACGATGLDYNVIPLVAQSVGVKKKNIPDILYDIRLLESEALKVMIEQREKK